MLLNTVFTGRMPTNYELLAGGRTVGWIRPGLVGFYGFASRALAEEAARTAAAVLDAWYAEREQSIGRHAPETREDFLAYENLIRVDNVVVGRLLSVRIEEENRTHGFELAVPAATWLAVMLQLAQRIYVELSEDGRAPAAPDDAEERAEAAMMTGLTA